MQDIIYTAVMPVVVAMKVCLPVCDCVVAWSSGLVVIYIANIVKGESKGKAGKRSFTVLIMPSRILYYANIVINGKNQKFFVQYFLFIYFIVLR